MTDIKFSRLDKRGVTKVVVSNGAGAPFTIRADLQDEAERDKAIERISAKFPGLEPERIAEALEEEAARDQPETDKVADALLKYLRQPGLLQVFHSPEGEPFALVRIAASRKSEDPPRHETLRIRGAPFRDWLAREAFLGGFKALGAETLQTVLNQVAAGARFGAACVPVFVRVGEHEGAIYLDLANEEREIVCATPSGWTILRTEDAPVRMIRSRGTMPLPRPEHFDPEEAPARIGELRRYLNLDDQQWILARGFAVGMFRPRGPYATLVLTAEHGCGKSWTAEAFRTLVDPNVANNRRPPKDERDLSIAARNAHVLSLNNLSGLQSWLSDALCAVLDGGGFATRELHTDAEEVIFTGARPVILNGIEDVATKPDLADRAIHLALRRMDDSELKEEEELRTSFRAALPRILGGFMDAIVCGLRRWQEVRLDRKPRRLDFARWVEAAAPALGLQPGEFLSAYMENREGASSAALESSSFASAVAELVEEQAEWSGSAADLLARLTTDERKKLHGWPTTPRKVVSVLRTFAPSLRTNGIEIQEEGKDPKTRRTIYRLQRREARPFGSFGSSDAPPEWARQPANDPKDSKDATATAGSDETWTDPGDAEPGDWPGTDAPGMYPEREREDA